MFRTEMEFVRWLQGRVRTPDRRVRLSVGDDAALVRIRSGRELILTTDLSIENVHFGRGLHPARSVGHRALARSLSDIAAMGGTPRFALVSLAISKRATRRWIKAFYAGLLRLARRHRVTLIGGDTALVPGVGSADVIVAGEIPRGQALRRAGARPGDVICVSGRLGLAALGFELLKARSSRSKRLMATLPPGAAAEAVRAHLYPEPRCALGRYLSQKRLATAMMDISDGLSTDLARLCEASGVGARLLADRIPSPPLSLFRKSLSLALHGGEDYELLFTVSPSKAARLPKKIRGVALHQVGEISRSGKLTLVARDGKEVQLLPSGYDHFRKK